MANTRPEAEGSTEFVLSHAEAVLAGTLALMTALVQGCCDAHRPAIRRKRRGCGIGRLEWCSEPGHRTRAARCAPGCPAS